MNDCPGRLLPSLHLLQQAASCSESPQQLGWEQEMPYNIWGRFPHPPALSSTCRQIGVKSQPVLPIQGLGSVENITS